MARKLIRTRLTQPLTTGMDMEAWARSVAARMGKLLGDLREKQKPRVSQRELARRLETNHTWVRRVEGGDAPLTNEADIRTYVEALGVEPDDTLRKWGDLVAEGNGDHGPWEEVVILAGSLRREGEHRKQVEAAQVLWTELELQDEIPLSVLAHLLQHDMTARLAARAWCNDFLARNPTWSA